MNVQTVYPPAPKTPSDLADWSDVEALQKRMARQAEEMALLAPDVGRAKHILEYDSDRRKQALSRAMKAPLAGGESAAKAEAEARASETYAKELSQLSVEHKMAEEILMAWEASKIAWETCRSLMAMQRETVRL